ncbi:MAG: hypothetical protein ABSD63_07960 [Candidatus Korobacteraceae bacterium]
MKIAAGESVHEVDIPLCVGTVESSHFGPIRTDLADYFASGSIREFSASFADPFLCSLFGNLSTRYFRTLVSNSRSGPGKHTFEVFGENGT